MPRIAIAGFQHETNTFAPVQATLQNFINPGAWPALTRGEAIFDTFRPINLPIAGFMKAAADWDLYPIVWASAEPSAHVTDEAFETITGMIVDGLRSGGPFDGVYLDLHGAMVTESHQDGEGEILRRVREVIGPAVPLVTSLDLHVNLTPEMVARADALTIYRTYPHVDLAATGARAQALLAKLLDGDGARFAKALRQVDYLIPLYAQSTDLEPAASLYALLAGAGAGTVSADIAMGFPPADIHHSGAAVLAYGADQAAADAEADRLRAAFDTVEPRFDTRLLTPADAVREAVARGTPGAPAVIADVQDNPGAGGTSDTTGLLAALVAGGARQAALGVMWDAESAAEAHAAGLGADIELALGGRHGPGGVEPYRARYAVEALGDGTFLCTGEMYHGSTARIGPTALLRVVDGASEVRVVVSSGRFQCLDQAVFRHVGLEPKEQAIVGVKSTAHFRADFAPMASAVLLADAPGHHPCRLEALTYRNLRDGIRRAPRSSRTGSH